MLFAPYVCVHIFTAKLICAFVFAYADNWFSHEAAQFCLFYSTVNFGHICFSLGKGESIDY